MKPNFFLSEDETAIPDNYIACPTLERAIFLLDTCKHGNIGEILIDSRFLGFITIFSWLEDIVIKEGCPLPDNVAIMRNDSRNNLLFLLYAQKVYKNIEKFLDKKEA